LVGLYFVNPHLDWIYLIGLFLIALLLGYEHSLVSPNDLSKVNRAFFQVNGIISIGLFLVVLIQVVMK
jgi:4-hydroxybenzoate polyprenyltransferase